jgi:holliday junction DNA helicase RuvA
MIYSLTGPVSFKFASSIVLDVNQVGYLVHVTAHHLNSLSVGNTTTLITYHQFRENDQQLFGFQTESERQFFELLISVSGIGPKVGINIMSSVKTADLVQAIQSDNVMFITQCPGIGKKTAERLIIELKDKMVPFSGDISVIPKDTLTAMESQQHDTDDIVLALRQLGYQKEEIKRGFIKHAKALSGATDIEDQIKILLKYL